MKEETRNFHKIKNVITMQFERWQYLILIIWRWKNYTVFERKMHFFKPISLQEALVSLIVLSKITRFWRYQLSDIIGTSLPFSRLTEVIEITSSSNINWNGQDKNNTFIRIIDYSEFNSDNIYTLLEFLIVINLKILFLL